MPLLDLIPDDSPLPFTELMKRWQCEEKVLLQLGCTERIKFSIAVSDCDLQQVLKAERQEILSGGAPLSFFDVMDFNLTGYAYLLPASIFTLFSQGEVFPLVLEHKGELYVRVLYEKTNVKRITSADLLISREYVNYIEKLLNIETIGSYSMPLLQIMFQAINKFWNKENANPKGENEIIPWLKEQKIIDHKGERALSEREAQSIDQIIRPVKNKLGGNKRVSPMKQAARAKN